MIEPVGANVQLRELLHQAGWIYESAARAVNVVAAEHGETLRTNKSAIAHWVAGSKPQPRTIAYLVEALSRRLGRRVNSAEIGYGDVDTGVLAALPTDPVGALASLGSVDVGRRQVLAGAVYSLSALMLPVDYKREVHERAVRSAANGRIGWSEVQTVDDIRAAFSRADERLGGGFGRTAVVEYLATDVAAYCQARGTAPVRQAMFSAATQLAYLCGWKAHDVGREGLAQRYYLHAYQLAVESGDQGLVSYVMRILAHQAYDMGHSTNCLDLADAAVRTAQGLVDPHTNAQLMLTLAKAHAMNGERREALAVISRAETLMSTARDDGERPSWAAIHGLSPAQFNNHVAKVLVDLGDLEAAEEHFARSVRLYLDPVTMPRIYALASTWIAQVQCQRGLVEQACETWSKAFSMTSGIESSRIRESALTMRQMLAPYRPRKIPAVQRLLQA